MSIILFTFVIISVLFSQTCSASNNEKTDLPSEVLDKIHNITRCSYRDRRTKIEERGKFIVYYNVFLSMTQYKCHESVTLTTQCDYTYLDNLPVLIERWRGPISIALYAPGDDFLATLDSIGYLRNCENPLIKEYVTFHLFHEREHFPKGFKTGTNKMIEQYLNQHYNCKGKKPPYLRIRKESLYKTRFGLQYPINVARNIALESAQTHFVFAADVELIPSEGVINKFLRMIARNPHMEQTHQLHVYAVAVFEVTKNTKLPKNKTDLQSLYKNKRAFFFHWASCRECHSIPNPAKWMNSPESDELKSISTVKRLGKFKRWEPFYIGTHSEPPFDERVTWEGGSNKMIQDYTLCLLNYDIHVLNNVFLVHKSGIATRTEQQRFNKIDMAKLINLTIMPELQRIYGKRKGCMVGGEYTQWIK